MLETYAKVVSEKNFGWIGDRHLWDSKIQAKPMGRWIGSLMWAFKLDQSPTRITSNLIWAWSDHWVSIWIQLECVELNLVCDGMSLIENWWLGSIHHDGGSSLELEIGCDVRTNRIQVAEGWIIAACSSFKAVTQSDLMIKIFNRCKSRDGHWLRGIQDGIVHRLF